MRDLRLPDKHLTKEELAMAMKISTKYFWLGLLIIALGVVVLFNAVTASAAVVTVTGIFLLLGGALQIAVGFTAEGLGNKILTCCLCLHAQRG